MKRSSLLSVTVLIIFFLGSVARADSYNCDDLHLRLAAGLRALNSDVQALSDEIVSSGASPYKRMVLGEALASLGFYALANEQFAAADALKKDFVLGEFKRIFENQHSLPAFYYLYLQEKYPSDPAVLFYSARRNLSEPVLSREERDVAMKNARKELTEAEALPNPWPGTLGLFAMMEYNLGHTERSLKLADKELKANPDELMAQKVRIMALDRLTHEKGGSGTSVLMPLIQNALKAGPKDDELNLLLCRAYVGRGDFESALKPAFIGLMYHHDPHTLNDARAQVFELMKKIPREVFLHTLNSVCAQSDPAAGGRGLYATLLRLKVAELFSLAGERKEALAQFDTVLRMHPQFRAIAAFDLGREFAFCQRYADSLNYLNLACHLNRNSDREEKFEALRQRVERINKNLPRNFALRLKSRLVAVCDLAPEKNED